MNPGLIPRQDTAPVDDKSVRKPARAPPRLFRLRHRIHLQPIRPVLVFGRGFSPADAAGWQRLPVPGLPARQGQTGRRDGFEVTGIWNVAAVLLDMDGTLLDTEKVYFDSLVAALDSCGYRDDVVSLCHAMVGLPGPDCERMLLDRFGGDFPLAEISRTFAAQRDERFGAGLPLKRGTI